MMPDPTERNIDPLLFQTEIRTAKKLVLTLAIHDKNVTMAKVARVNITVWTGLALPFEERRGPKTHRDNELRAPISPKQRLIIAARVQSPIKVQVRGGGNLLLSTPRVHQGCDSPPHTGKQWPTPLSSVWPNSGASSIRI